MDNYLKINVGGEELRYPYVWLRDNCHCTQCFHPTARSRSINWNEFNINSKPKEVVQDKESVEVTWDDGHKSRYQNVWLKLRSFNPESKKKYDKTIYRPTKIPWHGKDFNSVFTKHDYNEILKSDEALYNWLNSFCQHGVALIKNTPASETAVDAIVERVAFIKRTHYGVKFIVQHVENTCNLAYLSSNLQMHTDLTYYEYGPGTNLLHCYVQTASRGGENLLVDGHYIAKYLKENHPKEYKLLTEVEIEWGDVGTENGHEFFKLNRAPVIALDKHGKIMRIHFSISQRSSFFPGSIEDVEPWYKAYSLFLDLSHKFAAQFKMETGDILVFDNIRLIHSRNGYEDNVDNKRKLIGAYLDWDEIYCRLRCLILKFKNNNGIW